MTIKTWKNHSEIVICLTEHCSNMNSSHWGEKENLNGDWWTGGVKIESPQLSQDDKVIQEQEESWRKEEIGIKIVKIKSKRFKSSDIQELSLYSIWC